MSSTVCVCRIQLQFHLLSVCLSICLSVCTVGPLCSYEEGPNSASTREDCSATFADYFATLQQVCEDGQPGVLEWTPDMDTPDTVYYQVWVCSCGVCVCAGVGVLMWVDMYVLVCVFVCACVCSCGCVSVGGCTCCMAVETDM